MKKVLLICWLIYLSISFSTAQSILAPSMNSFQGSAANLMYVGGGINASFQSTDLYVSHGNVYILEKSACATINPTITLKNEYELSSNLTGISYQWFLDDRAIPGATEYNFKAINSGRYAVQVGVSAGCQSALSSSILISILSIEEEKAFGIWPNPAANQISVSFPVQFGKMVHLKITDLLGRIVFEKKQFNAGETIDVRPFSNGTYLLRLISMEDERKNHVFKFIKAL
jgi:hypothetical protein